MFDEVKAYKNGANFIVPFFGPPCKLLHASISYFKLAALALNVNVHV